MSILASLERAYHQLAEEDKVPPIGYSDERISYCVVLNANGQPVGPPMDLRLRDHSGKNLVAQWISVPKRLGKRTSGVAPNFLWDKTAYSLGVKAKARGAAKEFSAFKKDHLEELRETDDKGLIALRLFLEHWRPESFDELGWPEEMKDAFVVFRLEEERNFIHDREAAHQLWLRIREEGRGLYGSKGREKTQRKEGLSDSVCLVTGNKAPIARLHTDIKGIRKISSADPSPDSIVSFNEEAFESYGHKKGGNSPISEKAVYAYIAALNHFLRTNENKVQLGDATTVFWADGSDTETVAQCEAVFAFLVNDTNDADDAISEQAIKSILEKMARGRPMEESRPDLPQGVRFYVLGLAPNAARISIRFWLEHDFATLAYHIRWHYRDMRLDPPPRQEQPSVRRCLLETVSTKVKNRYEHIPPQLAGEMLRAILTGRAYPQTLLATIIMRLRSDSDKAITDLRVALLKAVICRNRRTAGHLTKEDDLVSLDPKNTDPGYLLGRLFACFEHAQKQALGSKINATICDKYYGAASATPRSVFSILQRNAMNHLAKLRKGDNKSKRAEIKIDRAITQVYECSTPEKLFVATLTMERQAFFAIGYYHQKNAFFTKTPSNEEGKKEKENEE